MNVCKYEQRGEGWAVVVNGRDVVIARTKADARRIAEHMQDHDDEGEEE